MKLCWPDGIGLIGSTLEKPRLQCKPQIVFSFTIKTAIDYAFAQRPVFYCCSNNGQQTITIGLPGQIRIDTTSGLSRFPLPIGIRGVIVSPLFIQPTAIGSEYEDCTSFYLFRREVGLHKIYLISPYIGHKPLLSRMNIIVSTIKHLFKILILHWNPLLSKD